MSAPPPHTEPPPEQPDEQPDGTPVASGDERRSQTRGRRAFRAVLYGLGGLLALVVALVLGLLLMLQTNWGATRVSHALIGLADPFDAAQIEIGRVDGNWVTNLTLRDVHLFRLDSAATPLDTVSMARIDSVRLRYDLPPLLRRTLHVREAGAYGPTLTARQRPDSTWDLLDPFVSDQPADTTASTFSFRIDSLRVQDARLAAAFYNPRRDSTLRVHDLDLEAGPLHIGPDSTRLAVEDLAARFTPPAQELERRFDASLTLADQRLDVRRLALTSPYSDLTAEGTLRLPEDSTDTIDDVDFRLSATPLSFRDLAGFVGGVDTSRSLTLEARASSPESDGVMLTLEARLSDGGTVNLTAEGTPATTGPVRYRLRGSVRDLDPAFLTAAEPAGRINADVYANLEGASLERLDGPVNVELFDTEVAGYAPAPTQLALRFTSGIARLEARTGLMGTTLTADGSVRPFADTLAVDLRTRFAGLDLGRLAGDTTLQSRLGGTLRLEGAGTDLATARMDATLAFDTASALNDYRIGDGRLTARLRDGQLAFDGRLRSPRQGGLSLAGTVAGLADATLRYRLDPLRLDSLDLAALAGDTTQSRLTGQLTLQGAGTDPQTMTLDPLRVVVEQGLFGAYVIESADLRGALRGGRLSASGEAALAEAGTFALTASARPFDDPLTFAVTEGRFRHVDVGALMQDSTQYSDLSGTFSLQGRGTDPQTMRLVLDVALDSSQVNRQPIDVAALQAELQGGALDVDLALGVPGGTTRLAGSGRPFDEAPSFALREGRLEHLDVGALAGLPTLETDLNGTVALDLEGIAPGAMRLDARLNLEPSRINQAMLRRGSLRADAQDSTLRLDGALQFAQGQVTVDGLARLGAEPPTYRATFDADRVDLAALTGAADSLDADVSLQAEVEGSGLDPRTMTLTGRVASDRARYGDLVLQEMALAFGMERGTVRVDTLQLRSNLARASGDGRVVLYDTGRPDSSAFSMEAEITSLAPARTLAGAQLLALDGGDLRLDVTGPAGRPHFDLRADLSSFVYDDIRLAGFETRVQGVLGDSLALETLHTEGALAYLSLPSLAVRQIDYTAAYDTSAVRLVTELDIDDNTRGRIASTVDLRLDRQSVLLEEAALQLGTDRWELLQEATLTYGDAYRISNLLLYSDNQQIALDGVVDLDGRQSLIMTIENVQVDAIANVLDFQGLGGTLNGMLDLTGEAAAPLLTGTLDYAIRSDGEPAGDLQLALRYDSLAMNVDARVTHREGNTLRAQGSVPLDLRLQTPTDTTGAAGALLDLERPINLSVRADSFDIGWVRPFLDPETVDRIDGELTARIDVGGTPDAPSLSGGAYLRDGAVGLPLLGVTYRDLQAALEFAEDRVELTELRLRSNDGSLRADGTINLSNLTLGEYDISLRASELLAMNTSDAQLEADARIELQGTTDRPQLSGSIDLRSGNYYIDDAGAGTDAAEVQLTETDIRALEQRFGVRLAEADTTTSDVYTALAIDLDVNIQRDVWLRSRANPEMAIQFTGDLDVQKPSGGNLQLFGQIEVIPERSYVDQFGRRFSITDGTLTFNGPPEDPELDVAAAYEVDARRSVGNQATITLDISGRLDDLGLMLGSEPQMETTDILSYIAFGRPASAGFAGGGTGGGTGGAGSNQNAANLATDFALGLGAGQLESFFASEAGLDVVEIEVDQLRGATFTAGKYIDVAGLPRPLYVGVSQPVNRGTTTEDASGVDLDPTQLTLEYELTGWLLVRLLRRNSIRVNLLWEYAY